MLVRPDVIVVSPKCMDYPLWRAHIDLYHSYFGRVYNVLYNDNRPGDYSRFVAESSPLISCLDNQGNTGRDWREAAVKLALSKSTSEWVLFLEQDFMPVHGPSFYDRCLDSDLLASCDAVGFVDGDELKIGVRLHPAFLLVRRSFVDRTTLDFAPHTDQGRDHFGVFSDDLLKLGARIKTLASIGLPSTVWKHWAGVTHNFNLVMAGEKPCYMIDDFKEFVRQSLGVHVRQNPTFMALCQQALES